MNENLPNPQVVPESPAQPVVPAAPPAPETVTPPPVPNSTPAPPPPVMPPAPQKKNLILWISLTLLVLAVVLAAIYFLAKGPLFSGQKNGGGATTVPSPTTTPLDETATWKVYTSSDQRISFKYPAEAKLGESGDGGISLTIVGPTQKIGTEFFDGLNLTFTIKNLSGKTLKEIYENETGKGTKVAEISATGAATLAGISGYKFHTVGLGEWDSYLLPFGDETYLEITNSTKDPANQGFFEKATLILSTLKISTPSASISPLASPSATPLE